MKQYIESNKERFLEELFSLLRIPSVSSLEQHKPDMVRCADRLVELLLEAGADEAAVYPTTGHPLVFGQKITDPSLPTVLVYGHYDVQPVDPIELWHSDPFEPDSKLQMLMQLKDEAEILIVISALDIEKNKVRGDLGITYDEDVLRLRSEFENVGFYVSSVVMTHYNGQASADAYRQRLERLGIKVYYHYTIEGYPNNVALIDSEEGFGKNDYVETSRPLVVVTAPGPGSGKMAVCLSQLYH